MTENIVRFVLRLPTDLHARLRAIAQHEERSLHAQILYLLRRAVESEQRRDGD